MRMISDARGFLTVLFKITRTISDAPVEGPQFASFVEMFLGGLERVSLADVGGHDAL